MLRVWRIVDKVRSGAIFGVTPDMPKIEPVANLMGGRSAKIKGGGRGARRPERGIEDNDAVGSGGAARKLRIA